MLQKGDVFVLQRNFGNNTGDSMTVDEYLVLEAFQAYWFWPGWTLDIDFATMTIDAETEGSGYLLPFLCPEGAGNGDGLKFWGAFFVHGTYDLLAIDTVEWSYSS